MATLVFYQIQSEFFVDYVRRTRCYKYVIVYVVIDNFMNVTNIRKLMSFLVACLQLSATTVLHLKLDAALVL